MRKFKKSLMACLIAVFALTLGAGLGFMPKANTAKAASTDVNFNVVYLEGDIAEEGVMQIRLNTEGQTWATYYNDKLLSELPGNVADNVTINGRTLREIENASTSTGSIRVSMQPAGTFSFIRAFIPLDMMKSSDISTIGVLGDFNFTEGDVTFTSPAITYIRVGNDMVKASNYTEKETLTSADVTISDAQLTHRVHAERGADSYMVDINVGASFGEYDTMYGGFAAIRDFIYINGRSIEEWNEQMIAEDPRFNEPSTYTYFPQNSTDASHKDYFVKPVGFWGTSTGFRLSIFQELVATCETIEVTVGAGCEINGKVVSERISKTVWTQNVVDVTNKLSFLDNSHNSPAEWGATSMYYINTDGEACWTKAPKGGCLNEYDPSDAGGGQIQLKYVYFNGTSVWDINKNDNGAYESTQGNIANGGNYAPIFAAMSAELGSSLKLIVPTAFTNGKAGHEEIIIKKGFSVYENGTSYVVTRDIIFTNTGSGWVKEVKIDEVETEIIGAFVSGSEGDNFTFLKLSVHDYPETIDNYGGTVMSVKDFINEDNFYSKIFINDSPLASRSEALINVWGNKGVMAFRTNTGVNATKITILAGCKIPSYAMLADGTMKCFVTTEDVTFVKNGDSWEVQTEVVFDLDAYKAEKIAEIQAYKQGEVLNENERLEILDAAIELINDAANRAEVDEYVALAIEMIDELELMPEAPDLSELKDAAKAELNAYLAGDYEALKALDRAIAVAQGKDLIEAATTEEGIAQALADAKALVDASLERVANVVDVTAIIKVMNCNKENGAIYIQIIIPEIEATVAGEQHYNVKIGDVLNAFGFWDNVLIGDKTLREWGMTGGWDNDDVIGYNVSEPKNNIYIRAKSTNGLWAESDVTFTHGIVDNYDMTIKEGTLLPSQAYFTGAEAYDVYRVKLEMVSNFGELAYNVHGSAASDVVDVQLAQDNGDSVYLALGLSHNDFPTEGGHVEVADHYYTGLYNGYWTQVKVNGANGIGKYALFNLNEGGNGRIAVTIHMPYDQINSITIPAGTAFPTYALQNLPAFNNNNVLIVLLKTTHDVTFVKMENGTWVNVEAHKASALGALAGTKLSLSKDDYFVSHYAQIEAAYEEGIALINNASTVTAIDHALAEAIALIDAVPTKAGFIDAAKAEIGSYKAGLFRADEEAERLEIVAIANEMLDEATAGVEEVEDILNQAKEAIDELKTAAQYADEELAAQKAAAREEIANYLDKANYYADEQAEIDAAITAGHQDVANATNEEEIAQAIVDAKLALDEVLTKEEVVEAIKADLDAYKAEGVFRAEEQAQRDAIVAKALDDLAGLTDKAEIDAIVATAKTAVDALTTADEHLEAELAEAKAAARAEVEAYRADGDYIPSQAALIAEAKADGLEAIAEAKSLEAIAEAVEEAKAYIDEIADSVSIVDVAMVVYISDIHAAGGNMNMFISIPGYDATHAANSDGISFARYSKEQLEALFNDFGLFDMIYINGISLRDWGFVGFWNESVGFNFDPVKPSIYLHMHTDNPAYAEAVANGDITFTKYVDGALAIKQSPVAVKEGLLIPGYSFLSDAENAVVYRAVADFVTEGAARPFDVEATATTNVNSVVYVQEDRNAETGEFLGQGYFGFSLEGDDYPSAEEHELVNDVILNYVNFDGILINGEPGLIGRYSLYSLGEKGKGYISVQVTIAEEDMYSVTIPAGTIFPAYAANVFPATNVANVFVFYKTAEDVTFVKTADGEWMKFADYVELSKNTLDELKAEKESIDCFAADLVLIETTIANAKADLDAATSAEEVAAIFANAKAIIEGVQAKDEVIANAKADLDSYKTGLYRDAEEAQRVAAVATAKEAIDAANSSEEVAGAVANAKATIDALKTANEYAKEEIAAEVESAKNTLSGYKADADLYRDEEAEERLAIIAQAEASLDEALTSDEVATIVANAKAAIDALKTDAEYEAEEFLAMIKEDAIAQVGAKKATIDLSIYSEEAISTISTLYNEALSAIRNANSEEEITAIVAKFEADIDAVPNKDQENAESNGSTQAPVKSGCLGNIGGLNSVFALLTVMAAAVVLKKKR